jgi:hypothetical protein
MDLMVDDNPQMAQYRAFKYVMFAGMGTAIGNNVKGFDAALMQLFLKYYEVDVMPRIEQNNNFPQSNFKP